MHRARLIKLNTISRGQQGIAWTLPGNVPIKAIIISRINDAFIHLNQVEYFIVNVF